MLYLHTHTRDPRFRHKQFRSNVIPINFTLTFFAVHLYSLPLRDSTLSPTNSLTLPLSPTHLPHTLTHLLISLFLHLSFAISVPPKSLQFQYPFLHFSLLTQHLHTFLPCAPCFLSTTCSQVSCSFPHNLHNLSFSFSQYIPSLTSSRNLYFAIFPYAFSVHPFFK